MKIIPNGVYPTMITPFTDDNKIDYNAVEQLIQWYADRGVAGIFAICQSSEIFFLSFEEKLELLKFIVDKAPKGVSIIASGHTAEDIETQIEEAKVICDVGIDAYVFISNRFAAPEESDDVLLERMTKVANALPEDIGLGVYECPYPYKRILSPYLLKEMSKNPRYQFLKDTCCSIEMIKAKLDAVKGTNLRIFNANSATLLESLRLGCAGFSGVMANFHPELYAELCEIYESNPEKAEKIQNFVGFASVAEYQLYPVNAKYHLKLTGIDMGIHTRSKDATKFTESQRKEIEQLYKLTEMFKEMIK